MTKKNRSLTDAVPLLMHYPTYEIINNKFKGFDRAFHDTIDLFSGRFNSKWLLYALECDTEMI